MIAERPGGLSPGLCGDSDGAEGGAFPAKGRRGCWERWVNRNGGMPGAFLSLSRLSQQLSRQRAQRVRGCRRQKRSTQGPTVFFIIQRERIGGARFFLAFYRFCGLRFLHVQKAQSRSSGPFCHELGQGDAEPEGGNQECFRTRRTASTTSTTRLTSATISGTPYLTPRAGKAAKKAEAELNGSARSALEAALLSVAAA